MKLPKNNWFVLVERRLSTNNVNGVESGVKAIATEKATQLVDSVKRNMTSSIQFVDDTLGVTEVCTCTHMIINFCKKEAEWSGGYNHEPCGELVKYYTIYPTDTPCYNHEPCGELVKYYTIYLTDTPCYLLTLFIHYDRVANRAGKTGKTAFFEKGAGKAGKRHLFTYSRLEKLEKVFLLFNNIFLCNFLISYLVLNLFFLHFKVGISSNKYSNQFRKEY